MRLFRRRRKDTIPMVMQVGRWTCEKEGETPSQAMRRLEVGGPDVGEYEYASTPHFPPTPRENAPDSPDAT